MEPSAPTLRFGRLRGCVSARVPGVRRYGSKAAVPAEPGGAVWSSVADKYTAKCAVHVGYGEWGGADPWVYVRWELDDKLTNKGKVEVVRNLLPLVVMSFT